MKITTENANETNLSKLPYGLLKETFEDLGVPSAWQPGGKAKDLIKDALTKLEFAKDLKKDDSLSLEEIQVQIELKDEEEKEKVKARAKAKAKLDALVKKEKETMIKAEAVVNKEELELKISKLNRAILNCISTHKAGLVSKLQVFEKMLADGDHL